MNGQDDQREPKVTIARSDFDALLFDLDGVQAYDSTVRLVRKAREMGFKVAIISASKSCAAVLKTAQLEDLFQARVDGVTATQFGLKGKPAPDVFLEAARRLDVTPARSVVVEDAVAGAEAGRRGGFGLVIGLDRTGKPERLKEHGAHVVVSDLAEVVVASAAARANAGANTADLPSALDRVTAILTPPSRRIAVFLDYDGTLTPIVAHPEDAVLSQSMQETVRRLARHATVGIV